MLRLYALSIALHLYIGWRIAPDLPHPPWPLAFALLLAASAACVPLGLVARRLARPPLADRLAWLGLLCLGLFSSLFVLTLLRDVALLVVASERVSAVTAQAVPLLAALLSAVGLVNVRRTARPVEVAVAIAGLPAALEGFRIVQISDIHVGPTIKGPYLQRVVEQVNALRPDAVAITGDLVDGSVAELRDDVAPLAGLHATHGSFFVTGNHEYYSGAHAWLVQLRRFGVRVLLNEHVLIDHRGATLVLAGVTDYGAGHFDPEHRSDPARAMHGAPSDAPKVLLAHQPRSAPAAAQAGFDLQLSGHTHGGQFLPWNLFVPLQQPYTAGLHRHGAMWLYVSRGTGYWGPPKRVGAPSEITLVILRSESG